MYQTVTGSRESSSSRRYRLVRLPTRQFSLLAIDGYVIVEESPKERVERDKALAETLGKIEVRFERGYVGGLTGRSSHHAINTTDMVLAEKSLKGKGISHGTT